MDDFMNYMGYEWLLIDGGLLTIGINETGVEEFTELNSADLPSEGDEVFPDEVCGELDTDQGPMNLYSPISGTVVEVNEAVLENPDLIFEDPLGDGWLFKVEPDSQDDLDNLKSASSGEDN